jgi:hypothetical protein
MRGRGRGGTRSPPTGTESAGGDLAGAAGGDLAVRPAGRDRRPDIGLVGGSEGVRIEVSAGI